MTVDAIVPVDHYGPSTVVKFYEDDLLFVGQGPLLRIFNYKSGELITTKQIFTRNKIHGICFQRDTFAFHGGRSLSILSYDQIMSDSDLTQEEKAIHDWIVSAEFCYNGLELFILTAHNHVFSVDSYSQTLQWEKSLHGEKSILYSGSIKVSSRYDVYITAGTVQGRILVWDLFKEKIRHALDAHAGPVFNVQVSMGDKYIVSCSDDRAIKLWDFKTGDLLSTAWGHTARIWRLKFHGDCAGVLSVSEDLTARTWQITEEKQLVPVHTYELHTGRHVWGLDVDPEGAIAATGGNDGRVRLIDINPRKVDSETGRFTLEEIVEASGATAEYEVQKGELVKGVWQLDAGIVIITSLGGIFFHQNNEWRFIRKDGDFNSLTLTNGFTKQNVITFTNSNGQTLFVKFNNEGQIIKEAKITTKISKCVNAISTQDGEKLYILIESPNKREKLALYHFNGDLEITGTTHIENPVTFVTTCVEVRNDLIYIGFRLSSMGIYDLATGSQQTFIKKLSLTDTVTSIRCIEDTPLSTLLAVTNRDGYYMYIRYFKSTNTHTILQTNNVRKGFLEGSMDVGSELITFGFKSSYFYIYNESRDYEIAYDNCGGAHRLWKLFYDDGAWKLIYVRDSVLHIRTVPKPSTPFLLTEGTHGRETRDISIRKTMIDDKRALYVTGGEETLLKLGAIDLKTGSNKHFWTVRKHNSGLQKVRFLNDELLASSSAREEFFIWKIDESYNVPFMGLIGTLGSSSNNPDLRIMDFDHLFVYDGEMLKGAVICNIYSDSSIKLFYFDLTTYIFTPLVTGKYKICCLLNTKLVLRGGQIYVITGATDGHLAIWNVTSEIQYPASNNHLTYKENVDKKPLPEPSSVIAVHQNGIKSLEIIEKDDCVLAITGGDDNALGLTKFSFSDCSVDSEVVSHIPDAASSLITSLSPLSRDRVLAVSVDQVVKIWSYSGDKLACVSKQYTSVADTGSSDTIEVDGDEFALVGGAGLSLFEIK